jgi:hypothetical protein
MGVSFIIAAGLWQHILRSESRGTRDHILLSEIWESLNLEGQVPIFFIPQEQGDPVIRLGTGFPFLPRVRIAGLGWRCSTPPPYGQFFLESRGQSYFMTGGLPAMSLSWRQVPREARPVILFSKWTLAVTALMYHPLWREDGAVVYNCCWFSPAQSFSGSNPARFMTIFYSLRIATLPTWRARFPYLYPPGTAWPGYTPRHWVSLSLPPTTRRVTVELFDPTSTRDLFLFVPVLCLSPGSGLVM